MAIIDLFAVLITILILQLACTVYGRRHHHLALSSSAAIYNTVGWPSYVSGHERGGSYAALPPDLECPPCSELQCSADGSSSGNSFDSTAKIRCKGGVTMDVCNCCPVCAKVLGELCGGDFNFLGKCDKGLKCVYDNENQRDRNGFDADQFNSGVCRSEYPVANIEEAAAPQAQPLRSSSSAATTMMNEDQPWAMPQLSHRRRPATFEDNAAAAAAAHSHRRAREDTSAVRSYPSFDGGSDRDRVAIAPGVAATEISISGGTDQQQQKQQPQCRPACTPEFCATHPKEICSARHNADVARSCFGGGGGGSECQHTSCKACRHVEPAPERDCPRCAPDDFKCLKQYGRCVKKHLCSASRQRANSVCNNKNNHHLIRRRRRPATTQSSSSSSTTTILSLSSQQQQQRAAVFQCLVPECIG